MRIAILGGTFDPIHNGHLAAAQAVAEAFAVDEVQFIPTFSPPHKPVSGITSPFHRFAMVALATASIERFKISTIEVDCLEAPLFGGYPEIVAPEIPRFLVSLHHGDRHVRGNRELEGVSTAVQPYQLRSREPAGFPDARRCRAGETHRGRRDRQHWKSTGCLLLPVSGMRHFLNGHQGRTEAGR